MFLALPVGLFGLLVGSFLNVVIHRVPAGGSVISPPSHCPHCGHQIAWYDNIPVLSWLVLGGKCRQCAAPIAIRYPLVEVGTGVVFTAVAWWQGLSWMLVPLLYFAAISIALALIDLDCYRLPNSIVLPSAAGLALAVPCAAFLDGKIVILSAFGGALIFSGLLLTAALIKPGGMGMGDVKLALILGLFLGWQSWWAIPIGIFCSLLVGSFHGIIKMFLTAGPNRRKFPLGPGLLAGTWLALASWQQLAHWYLGLY